jgi:hypothetical protein
MHRLDLVMAAFSVSGALTPTPRRCWHPADSPSRYTSVLSVPASNQLVTSRLGMNRACEEDPRTQIPSALREKKVAASSKLPVLNSLGPRPRISIPAHLVSVVDHVSCAGRQHMHPPFRCSNTESMAVVLKPNQSVTID